MSEELKNDGLWKENKNVPSKMTLEEKKQQELIELVKLSKKLQKEKEKDGRL